MWSLDYLSISVPSKGRYKTIPLSPSVVKSFIQIPRQGQVTSTKNKKTIVVDKNKILTREIQSHMKPWVDIIRKNAICLGGHKDHVFACLCHMLYCIEASTRYNLAFFILKRMEKTRSKPKELLPYGMLLTRLFKHVVSIFPELAIDRYISHDRLSFPCLAKPSLASSSIQTMLCHVIPSFPLFKSPNSHTSLPPSPSLSSSSSSSMSCSNHHFNFSRKLRMSVRQVWKRKTSTPKSSHSSQKDSPLLPPRVYLQSSSPPSYNLLRDQMINQLHNISTILDSHTNPSNAYIHAPPSPPPQQIHPPYQA
ncbi:hypothetical protein Tco_1250786 [Tanacetum coccineum]